ncbi:MAG: hypothetical protein ISN64_00600 [Rickettsia sp.]|nr:hypothetical protein [Rickettsia sp.]
MANNNAEYRRTKKFPSKFSAKDALTHLRSCNDDGQGAKDAEKFFQDKFL